MIPPSPTRLALMLLAALLVPTTVRGVEADLTEKIGAYLSGRYYEVEFFVFERPEVMDFTAGEVLSLDRPRKVPHNIRTQRLHPDRLWPYPIDATTRLCLSYPTVTWVPDEDDEPAPDTPSPSSRPVPEIEPYLSPDPLLDLLARAAAFERSLEAEAERWQPADRFRLSREAGRVERTGLGRVLFHGRWLQDVPERGSPDPVLIEGGGELTPPWQVRELVGVVGVTLGRYLHFQADVYLQGPGFGLLPTGVAMGADGTAAAQDRPLPGPRYMMLSESRRMRSGEIHYLDHPKLGVVVRIDPVTLPADLIEAFGIYQQSLE